MLQYDLTAQKATTLDTERSLRLSLKRVQLENAVLTVQRDQGEKSIQQWLYKEMEWSEQRTQTAERIQQLEATLQERDDTIW
jgi:aspartate/glutamate racemase